MFLRISGGKSARHLGRSMVFPSISLRFQFQVRGGRWVSYAVFPIRRANFAFVFFNTAYRAVPGCGYAHATKPCCFIKPSTRESSLPTRVARRYCGYKDQEDSAGHSSLICAPSASRGRDGERVCDLKHEFASGRGGVDRLLVEVQIDAARLQGLDRAEQVDQRAPQPVYGPSHHHIEFAPSGVIEYLVQTGPPIPALSAADAVVLIDADAKPEDWQHLLEMAATWDMLAKQRPPGR